MNIEQSWREYNKLMKRVGSKPKTLEEYKQLKAGKYKPKLKGSKLPSYNVSNHRELYPSDDSMGYTPAKKPNVYTGSYIKGIATMHKSNAVPVTNQKQRFRS